MLYNLQTLQVNVKIHNMKMNKDSKTNRSIHNRKIETEGWYEQSDQTIKDSGQSQVKKLNL